MRPTLLAAALLASLSLSACCDDCNDTTVVTGPPIFQEAEPNDDPLTANDFGVLQIGDHFVIQGFVRDDAIDPFDGFAFTAASPLHVDFQLFSDGGSADLDACVYDPQLDQTVACFATQNDPEQGGVDVSAGGLAFHLVIESFVGDGPYSLDIVVQSLFAATAADGRMLAPSAGITGVNARAEHDTAAGDGYRREPRHSRPVIALDEELEVDRAKGLAIAIVHVRRDGLER